MRLHAGKGPVFLECMTYRQREHCGPNEDPFHPKDEALFWKKKDPIDRLLSDQGTKKYMTRFRRDAWKKAVQKEIDDAFLYAKQSAYADDTLGDHLVYAS